MPVRADRQFRARVHVPRQRRAAAVLQDRRRRPAPPRDRHRPPHAEAEGLAGDHPPGGRHADRGQPRRRSVHRLAISRTPRPQVKLFSLDGQFVQRRATAGHRHGGRFHRQAAHGKRTDTETFYSFSSLATPPSIYRLRPGHAARAASSAGPRRSSIPSDYEVEAGLLQEQGRHAGADVHRPSQGASSSTAAIRRCSTATAGSTSPLPPMFSISRAGVDGDGRRLRPGQPPRRRRIRRGLAPGRHEAQEAERLRRLHRRRRVADRQQVHAARQAGHPGRQQRRAAGRRGDDPAARPVRRLPAGGGRDGHAPLPQVHRRPHVGRRLRLVRRSRSSSRPCWPIRPITTSGRARAIRRRW